MTDKHKGDAASPLDTKSDAPKSDAFADRLRAVVGQEAVRAFARRASVSDGALRQYLSGKSQPSRRALACIAAAGGVSVGWLATGEDAGHYAVEKAAASADLEALPLDPLALRQAVQIVLETLEGAAPGRSYGRAANLITICYQALMSGMRPEMMRELLEGVRGDPGKST